MGSGSTCANLFWRYNMDSTAHDSVTPRPTYAECGKLIEHFQSRGARVVVLSEYGITAVSRPVHLNRVLREAGLLAVREEMGREILDAGASAAFAVADHQLAHVYVKEPGRVDH